MWWNLDLTGFSRFKWIALGVIALALSLYIGYLNIALSHARGKVAELNGTIAEQRGLLAEWKSAYSVLGAKVIEQNKAISDLHAQSEKKKAAGIKALAEAKKRASNAQQQAAWLSQQLAKPSTGKTCGDALREWRNS